MSDINFSLFEKKAGVTFKTKSFLRQAFTHRSYINENKTLKLEHNERLEFLGDAVLELVVTDFLYKKYQGEDPRLIIGSNNTIREYCTLNTGTVQGNGETVIGDNNWIMAYVHIAHDCIVGNNIIFANGVTLAGHITVKDWVILGGLVPVHQFCIIGEHAMVGGQTAVAQDIPPYTMASGYRAEPKGVNSEGLKRRGFNAAQIENIKQAYKILYRNGLSYSEAKTFIEEMAIENPELKLYVDFFAQSTRGIIR